MDVKQKRILIFGAGVVGSIYALRFAQYGLDVTLLARNKRLEDLRQNGLRYNEDGIIKHISIKTIETLQHDDIYDFIFVPVRYDHMESALLQLQNNQSKTIITLTNTVGYDSWTEIVGKRLLPGFPGAGGDIRDGVLYAQFGKESHQGTIFGEIDGHVTERVKEVAELLEVAQLHYEIQENIMAFHISHTATAVVVKYFCTENGMMNVETAKGEEVLRKIANELKENLRKVEQAGIPVIPSQTRALGDKSEEDIMDMYRHMLSHEFTIDVLLGEHAIRQQKEIRLLEQNFNEMIQRKQLRV